MVITFSVWLWFCNTYRNGRDPCPLLVEWSATVMVYINSICRSDPIHSFDEYIYIWRFWHEREPCTVWRFSPQLLFLTMFNVCLLHGCPCFPGSAFTKPKCLFDSIASGWVRACVRLARECDYTPFWKIQITINNHSLYHPFKLKFTPNLKCYWTSDCTHGKHLAQ